MAFQEFCMDEFLYTQVHSATNTRIDCEQPGLSIIDIKLKRVTQPSTYVGHTNIAIPFTINIKLIAFLYKEHTSNFLLFLYMTRAETTLVMACGVLPPRMVPHPTCLVPRNRNIPHPLLLLPLTTVF